MPPFHLRPFANRVENPRRTEMVDRLRIQMNDNNSFQLIIVSNARETKLLNFAVKNKLLGPGVLFERSIEICPCLDPDLSRVATREELHLLRLINFAAPQHETHLAKIVNERKMRITEEKPHKVLR